MCAPWRKCPVDFGVTPGRENKSLNMSVLISTKGNPTTCRQHI